MAHWTDETVEMVAREIAYFRLQEGAAHRHDDFAQRILTALADAGLLVPVLASEVLVHPSYLADDNIRVNLAHPDGLCRWSVAFPAQPTNRVPLLHILREIHRHDARCIAAPTTTGSPE